MFTRVIRILGNFASKIRNPVLCNLEFRSRKLNLADVMVPVARTNFRRQKGSNYLRGRGHLFLSKELCPQNHNVVISNEHKP